MRREPGFFEQQELDLIFMARRLPDALKIEDLLTEHGIDYLVETGPYTGGFLFKRDLAGAYFYVSPDDLERSRELLMANRYRPFKAERET